MFGNYNNILCLMSLFIIICSGCFPSGNHDDSKIDIDKPRSEDSREISWQKSFKENGMTIIPGSVQIDSIRFEFRWMIAADEEAKLVTLESDGSAELPLLEKKILFLVLENGITLLFQEYFPLADRKEPYTIILIATVSTIELFSVLPDTKLPPSSPLIIKTSSIRWGEVFQKKNVQYLEGSLTASFGTLNIFWKKAAGRIPELITIESPGAGELPPVESRLIPWIDETSATTVICQERYPQLNQEFISYLWCLASVKTDELMFGFKRLGIVCK